MTAAGYLGLDVVLSTNAAAHGAVLTHAICGPQPRLSFADASRRICDASRATIHRRPWANTLTVRNFCLIHHRPAELEYPSQQPFLCFFQEISGSMRWFKDLMGSYHRTFLLQKSGLGRTFYLEGVETTGCYQIVTHTGGTFTAEWVRMRCQSFRVES